MLTLIAIFVFAFAEFLFDYSAVAKCTNWYVFYFASTYLSIMLVSIDLMWRENSRSMQAASLGFIILFLSLIIMELSFINVPFDKYIVGVNNNKIRLLFFGLLAIFLIFISITAWEKRLSRR